MTQPPGDPQLNYPHHPGHNPSQGQGPPPPWGPPYPGQPAPPSRTNPAFWVFSAAVAVLVVVAVVLVVAKMRGPAAPPAPAAAPPASPGQPAAESAPPFTEAIPPAPNVNKALLREMLLSTGMLNDIHHIFSGGLAPVQDTTDMFGETTDPAECASVYSPVLKQAYEGSSPQGVAAQVLENPEESNKLVNQTIQAVVAFPDAAQAKGYVDQQSTQWRNCAEKDSIAVHITPEISIRPFDPKPIDGVLTTSWLKLGGTGRGCQRAIAARRNIVIDVRTCDWASSWAAPEVANKIVERVDNA
ncbi:sensor domain-containing protein [Mycobacterium hubeiense]|uniref:sensor domain-containing protein n=1 Tax=Mycobacterium hubeiense TaxID=1867256 RepID=UPI000C7EA826|nr:sensor domain-containing protein [Mycobacterium sp. QGD 101]